MPAFFLHGVPDTAEMWDGVRSHLSREDVIAPSMPGFGTPIPDGFDCTKEAYLGWLAEQVEAVGEPVDLVAHDWGCMLGQRLVSVRPDLVRTWAVGSGPLDETYDWHGTAKIWQTPVTGEQFMAAMTPEAMTGALTAAGVDAADAARSSSKIDDRMKDAILKLYRSATDVSHDWAQVADRPGGLVLWGADDPYAGVEMGRRLAARNGAKIVEFEGCGHWWPLQRPAETAAALEEHWAAVG